MIRHGKTSTGRQRWRCKPCKITTLNEIDSTAKHLDEFVAWLLGRCRQVDLPGGQKSGLRLVRHILRGVDDVHFSELGSDDVVRHQLVSAIVDAYDDYETAQIAKQERAEQGKRAQREERE